VQKQNGSGTWNECTVCKYQVVTCRHDSVVYDYVNNEPEVQNTYVKRIKNEDEIEKALIENKVTIFCYICY
jgi:hypothetical protein